MSVEETTELYAVEHETESTPRSVLDRIRATRTEHAQRHTLDVDVPGHRDPFVGLRLGAVSARTLSNIAERLEKSRAPERQFNVAIDTLCAAVVCILWRDSVNDDWQELRDEHGELLTLDARCVELLGLEGARQRELMLSLYSGANAPEMAVTAAAAEWNEWAATADQQTTEDTLGESSAATR